MVSDEHKLGGDEKDIEGSAEQETTFQEDSETVKFLPDKSDEAVAAGDKPSKTSASGDFQGLSRDELEQFATDPKWVKIRWILFAIFVVGWAAMLILAVIIVVVTPKCPPSPDLKWYEDGVAYIVDPLKFQDSDGDGIGDLAGIESRLDHFKDLSVESVWVVGVINSTMPKQTVSDVGTVDSFKSLATTFKKKGIRVVVSFDMDAQGLTVTEPQTYVDLAKHWTEAGAEGFLLTTTKSETNFTEPMKAMQDMLDEDFNKKDDRDRLVIAPQSQNTSWPGARAMWLDPREGIQGCSEPACQTKFQERIINAAENEDPWKILQIRNNVGMPGPGRVAYKLTLPGTPSILSGDEIGLPTDKYMRWDDSMSGGFTTKEDWTGNWASNVHSVLAQKAVGYTGVSVYEIFKSLAAVRAEEPSLKWGKFMWHDFGANITAFIREAEGFAPIAVVLHDQMEGVGKAGSLVYTKTTTNKKGKEKTEVFSKAEILVASGVDLEVGDVVDADAIFIPANSVLVAKLSDPDAKKGLF